MYRVEWNCLFSSPKGFCKTVMAQCSSYVVIDENKVEECQETTGL